MRGLSSNRLGTLLAVVALAGFLVDIGDAAAQGKRGAGGGGGAASLDVKSAPPVVVATVPQAGASDVDPGLTEIKVTFSKEMKDGNWAFAQVSKDKFPQTTGKPRYEQDKRTCVLPVKLEAGKTYVIPLNKKPFDSFMDADGRKAFEYLLVFETKK